jgi:CheY-like chemotaxis protein
VKVLLVEDDADNREIVRALLEQHHAEVWVASLAREALEFLAAQRPHILVSDIGLPEMDGYALMQQIRSIDGPTHRIPAVALTAHASADDRTRAMRAGYQAHIAKPVEPGELVATIQSLTELAWARERAELLPS